MRIAINSDVHGNLEALRAVIPQLQRQSPDAIVNLGDCVSAPLWPQETFEELQSLGATTVRGNHDRCLVGDEWRKSSRTVAFTVEQLSADAIETLVTLPATALIFDDVLAVHGTPASDTEYLLEESVDDRLCPVTTETIGHRVGETSAELVLCGHSHQQRTAFAPGGKLVINPGSVGCPRYADNPEVSANEAGSPHARYAVATRAQGRWSAELFVLSYDWSTVVKRATSVGRDDWAAAFLKGS